MTTGRTAPVVRAIEREQNGTRIHYTERASRHYRTSCEGVGVERDFCIAMVFGPQLTSCTGRACDRLDYRRIYVLSLNSALQSAVFCAPRSRPRLGLLYLRAYLGYCRSEMDGTSTPWEL
jgi:hypothetical protein